jgi:hypothetical protein
MKVWSAVRRQSTDFIVYLAVPLLSVVLPLSWSRALLSRVSKLQWILAEESEGAFLCAADHVDTGAGREWKTRWKRVEMLDARDLYLIMFGRSGAVLGEIVCDTPLDVIEGRFLIGMHWGPSISILKLLQKADLAPAIPFRQPERELLRSRPFYYLFASMAARYIVRTMDVPNAAAASGRVMRSMMGQAGTAMIVMDAPPREGRSTLAATVLGREATFDAGFPAILADKKREYVFYAMSLGAGDSLGKVLELQGPFDSTETHEFLQNYAAFLDRHLASDPAQWRIWQAAGQFWR